MVFTSFPFVLWREQCIVYGFSIPNSAAFVNGFVHCFWKEWAAGGFSIPQKCVMLRKNSRFAAEGGYPYEDQCVSGCALPSAAPSGGGAPSGGDGGHCGGVGQWLYLESVVETERVGLQ
jgi:hypothetical protein